MTYIRVKGKHLMLTGLALLILTVVIIVLAPSAIYDRAQSLEREGQAERAQIYYELLFKYFPLSDVTARALYSTAQRDIGYLSGGGEAGFVYIFPGSTGYKGGAQTEISIMEGIKRLETLRERFPESPWAGHALHELGKSYFALGDYDKAEKYLKESLAGGGLNSIMLLAEMYLQQGLYNQALELADRNLREEPGINQLEMSEIKGRALISLGRLGEARQVFEAIPGQAEKIFGNIGDVDRGTEIKDSNVQHWDSIAEGYLRRIDVLRKGAAVCSIEGRVALGDRGQGGVYVYLIDKAMHEDYYTGVTEGLPRVVTEPDGSFFFGGLAPGRYALGIGVRLNDIRGYTLSPRKEDLLLNTGQSAYREFTFAPVIKLEAPLAAEIDSEKVVFKWKSVPGAASYDLFLGPVRRDDNGNIDSMYTSVMWPGIKDNKLEVDLTEKITRNHTSGGVVYNDGMANPEAILGFFYPGGEYAWGVYAYDSDGNRLTDSAGYGFYGQEKDLPAFKLNVGSLNDADRLILSRNYEEAVQSYQAMLQVNPGDSHALLMLARLFRYGNGPEKSDLAAAADYYERLLQVDDTAETRTALADVYYDAGEYSKAAEMYSSLQGTEAENWRTYYQLGKIKFIQGEPQAALEILEQSVDLEHGVYARTYPVAVALILGRQDLALTLTGKVDEGDEYYGLLKEYCNQGYAIKDDVLAEIKAGRYRQAGEMLTGSQHDLFIATLLDYAMAGPYSRERINKVAVGMESGLLKELLLRMLT